MKQHIANLGDVDFIEYGGFLVYADKSVEIIQEPSDDGPEHWTVYRFDIEPHTYLDGRTSEGRFIGKVLSDNPYRPSFAVWYADDIESVTSTADYPKGADGLRSDLCSDDPLKQARAYQALVGHFGAYEFDQYPETFSRDEIEKRYRS